MTLKKMMKDLGIDKLPYDVHFEASQKIIDLRVENGWTQKQLAKKAGTKQSGIARAENGAYPVSLSFLQRIAKAAGKNVYITIK